MESKIEQGGLILLIMCDRLQVSVFTEKLRGYGYNDIEVYSDGKAALEKLHEIEPVVVITDVELKGELNGIVTGRKIRDQYDLPLIYMSRLQDEKTFQKALDTHPHAFLNKPVNWNELRMAIESAKFNNQDKASLQTGTDMFIQRLEEAHVPYHILDTDGILTGVNKAWTELTGYTADEVRGRWFGDFLYRNFQEKFRQDFMTIRKKGVSHDLEYDFLGKDMQIITISLTCLTNTDRYRDFVSMYCIPSDITEKKKLQKKLRESEERFRTLFEEAPLGYQSLAENGGIIYVNHAWCRMLGYDKEEVNGKWFGDFLSPEDREKFRRNFARLKQMGVAYSVEYEMIKKDKTSIYVSIDEKVRYDGQGNYIQSHSILKEITEQKLAEDALLENEKKFRKRENEIRTITDNIPALISYIDANGRYRFINRQYEKWFGIPSDMIIGKHYKEVLGEIAYEQIKDHVDKALSGKRLTYDDELSYVHGGTRWITAEYIPDFDDKGKVSGFFALVTDITERKQAEEELRASEERYRGLANSITDIFFAMDKDLKYTFWNKASEKLTGISERQAIGKHLLEIFPDTSQIRKVERVYRDVLKKRKATTFTNDFTLGNRDFVFEISAYPAGEGISVFVKDITERKKIESELYESRQMLQIVLDTIPDGVFWKDRDLLYRGGNRTFLNANGFNHSGEVVGKTDYDLPWNEKLANAFREQDKRIMESGIPEYDILESVTLANETRSWARTNKVPMRDTEGNIMGILGTYEDITGRKQTEEKFQRALERLDLATSAAHVGIWDWDIQKNILEWDDEMYKIYGIQKEDFPSAYEAWLNGLHPDDRSYSDEISKIARSGKGEYHTEFRIIWPDGSIRHIEAHGQVIQDENGEPLRMIGINFDITDRKEIESELFNSKQMLQLVLDTIPAAVFWKDRDLIYLGGNHAFMNAVGLKSPEELIGKMDYDLPWDEDQAKSFREYDKKIIDSGIPEFDITESFTQADGTHSWARTNKVPMRDTEGNIIGILGTYEDITGRKQAEEALRTSEAQLSNAMEIARLGYWEYDVAKDMFTFDDHFYSIFHTTAEQVGGYTMSSARYTELFLYPEDRHLLVAEIQKALEATDPNYSCQVEHRVRYADGSTSYISVRYYIVKDDQGRTIRTYGVNQDITERKQIEQELQESEERYRQIFQYYPIGIVLTNQDKKFISVNPSFCKMFGYTEEELKGMTFLDVTHPEHQDTDKEKIDSLWRGKIPEYRTEKRYITRNGNVIWGNLISTLIRDQDDKPLRALAMIQDITDRKKAETELLTSEARFKAFMDNLPVMTYIKDKKGKYVYGNKANLKLAGITLNQFRDTEVSDYLPANLAKWMKQMDKRVLITGKALELDEWKYVKGNIERWFTEYKFPITASDEEQLIGGWMMDITRRKAVESALKESEKIYKDLVEKAGIAIMTDDINGNITYFNREFARLFGYTIAGMKKQSHDTLIHREDLEKMITYHNKRMKGEKAPDRYELRGIQKNGNEIWIEVKTTVLLKQDMIIGTRNYMWDITERKKTLQALKNSETRFRELFSNMSNGVGIYEYIPEYDEFVFRDMNKAGMQIGKIKNLENISGKSIIECFPGVDRLGLLDAMKKVWRTGQPERVPDNNYKDNRLELYVDNKVFKLPTGEIVVVFDDITNRKEADLKLKKSYEQIKNLSRHVETIREEDRKQIARDLHDDLGQMLTAIKMDVSWIRNKLPQDERKGIKKRIKSTIDITDQAIRGVSRLSSELRPGVLDDLGLMEALNAYFGDYEKRVGIKIRTNIPEKDPNFHPDQVISVYRIIQEALTNVARHANATEADLTMKEKNSNLEIRIHDNGGGISKDKAQSPESFGILSMKERVIGWGGTFEIRGVKNRGTTINIMMPVL